MKNISGAIRRLEHAVIWFNKVVIVVVVAAVVFVVVVVVVVVLNM